MPGENDFLCYENILPLFKDYKGFFYQSYDSFHQTPFLCNSFFLLLLFYLLLGKIKTIFMRNRI